MLKTLDPFRAWRRWRTKAPAASLQDRFTRVYRYGAWRSKVSRSGFGSEPGSAAARHCLDVLGRVIAEYEIRSIADVPCGEIGWIEALLRAHPEVAYTGYDIVGPVIEANRRRRADLRFERIDATVRTFARADLVFCKDLINHLPEALVWRFLDRVCASGSTWLLITSNRDHGNSPLRMTHVGASRHVNLSRDPYDLPPPVFEDHYLSLWRVSDLDAFLNGRAGVAA